MKIIIESEINKNLIKNNIEIIEELVRDHFCAFLKNENERKSALKDYAVYIYDNPYLEDWTDGQKAIERSLNQIEKYSKDSPKLICVCDKEILIKLKKVTYPNYLDSLLQKLAYLNRDDLRNITEKLEENSFIFESVPDSVLLEYAVRKNDEYKKKLTQKENEIKKTISLENKFLKEQVEDVQRELVRLELRSDLYREEAIKKIKEYEYSNTESTTQIEFYKNKVRKLEDRLGRCKIQENTLLFEFYKDVFKEKVIRPKIFTITGKKLKDSIDTLMASDLFESKWVTQKLELQSNELKKFLLLYVTNAIFFYMPPSGRFDAVRYLRENKDVKDSGMNPLLHYIKFGREEKRKIYSADGRDHG